MRYPTFYHDVDFCLRLRQRGWRIVFTPHAKLWRHQPSAYGSEGATDAVRRREGELRQLRSAWGETLLNDPYYSPLLSLDATPYTGLAWPPRSLAPRLPSGAPARVVPPGF
jgi:hypothetical protein